MSKAHIGKVASPEQRKRMSESHIGKVAGPANPRWRGDNVGYGALHAWVARHRKKTGVCEDCGRYFGTKGTRGTQWANISGKYRRDLADFRELCARCHTAFDLGRRGDGPPEDGDSPS
jgi:hypothetical protein